MDHRTLYGVAAVFLSGAIFVHSLTSANALPTYPTGTSHNEFPYESIQCDGCNSSTPFLTVPSDKYFILTTATTGASPCEIDIDGQNTHSRRLRAFNTGDGRLVVPSNSTISSPYQTKCYVEGYWAEPSGLNFESMYGSIAANSTATILSVPSDKNFIITGGAVNSQSSNISIYSDNDLVLITMNMTDKDRDNVFQNNKAHLKIPAGTDLKLVNTESNTRDYYLQGYYAPI